MRTTVTLDDHLFDEAKILAVKRRTSLGSVIEEALRDYLAQQQAVSPAAELPTYGERGVQPGVDLSDNSSMLDAMD